MRSPFSKVSWWALVFFQLALAVLTSTASSTCLPDAVASELRKDVTIDGAKLPLGIWGNTWQSALMNYNIFKLIASEVLGYNVEETGLSAVVVAGMWAIAGCKVPVLESEVDEKCDLSDGVVSTTHLVFETWDFYLPTTLEAFEKKYPHRAPTKLGGETVDMGFDGIVGNYFPKATMDAALEDGHILSSYITYNASRWDVSKYFSSLEEVNTTEFYNSASRCADYQPMSEDFMAKQYLRHFPEDPDGIETYTDSNGETKQRGYCEDGVWWLSPACRANRSSCIPWLSILGYGYLIMWHKATYYNMPIAMASSYNWVEVSHKHTVMQYAWEPYATYMNRELTQLLFPAYDGEQQDDYLYIGEFPTVKTAKWAHPDLEESAPRVWIAAQRMNVTKTMMNNLLEYMVGNNLTSEEAACHFLQTRQDWWEGWVTPNTDCQEGMGLFTNDEGDYECEWCPRATMSVEGMVEGQSTRYCQECAIGTYQEHTQSTTCTPCEAGTYNNQLGAVVCQKCAQGYYQSEEGASACVLCPTGRTTKILGANAHGDCVCDEGSYEPSGASCEAANESCACVECMEGLKCPVGSRLDAWKEEISTGAAVTDSIPRVLPGYYSLKEDPVSIYTCDEENACPGGEPETCSGGRITLTCTRCPSQHYLSPADRNCHECEGWEIGMAIPVALLGVVGLTIAHAAVNWPVTTASQWTMTLVFLAGMGITTCLTFNIYANLAFVPAAPLTDLFALLKIMAFDTELLRISCLTGDDSQVVKYTLKLATIPFAFALLVIGSFLTSRIPAFKTRAAFNAAGLHNSMGMTFTIFFISVSLMSLEAFRCDLHPNGKTSLTADRSVTCWEKGDHGKLVALSILAICVYPLPFLACTATMTFYYKSLSRRCGASFTNRSRFLFNRMGPDNVAFAFWFNIRNFALTMVPVIATNNFYMQIILLVFCFVLWLLVQMTARPWRFQLLNRFDSFTSAVQILMLVCLSMLGDSAVGAESDSTLTGWIVICLFTSIMGSIAIVVVSRIARIVLMRFSKTKEFSIFLSHHKESSGRFARQLKLMLSDVTTKKVFLDVDELQNLDNLNFTVRQNTEHVVVLMTNETLTRLWVAVEVVSAVMHDVPVHLVAATDTFDSKLQFNEDWLNAIPSMWAALDVVEFNKIGLNLDDIESAYRFLSTLPVIPLRMEMAFMSQWNGCQHLLKELRIPGRKKKEWTPDPDYHVYLGYDSTSTTHCCTARILHMLFEQRLWNSHFQEELKDFHLVTTQVSVAIAVLGKGFIENPECVGFVTFMSLYQVPTVTVLSGEAFWKPGEGYFASIHEGTAFSKEQMEVISRYVPRLQLDTIATAIALLYKILAWRFNPEESEPVMLTEFSLISERAQVERVKVELSGCYTSVGSVSELLENPDESSQLGRQEGLQDDYSVRQATVSTL